MNNSDKQIHYSRAIFLAALSEAVFGSSFVFIKMVDESISLITLLSWRSIIGFIAMSLLIKSRIFHVNFKGKDLKPLILISLFQPVLYYIFETLGVRLTTASESGMILSCCPVITMIFSMIFIGEKVRPLQILFMIITVSGGLLAAALGGISSSGNILGYFFLFLAACCEASYASLSSIVSSFNEMEKTYAMLCSGMIVFTSSALFEHFKNGTILDYIFLPLHDSKFLIAVLFLSIGCNVFAFMLANYVLPIIGPTKRGACGGLGTIAAILGGVILLHESYTIGQLIATLLILAGAYGVIFTEKTDNGRQ